MRVSEVMTSGIKTVTMTDSVKTFLSMMEEYDISGMPVVDADGALVGFASKTDVSSIVSDPPLATEADRDFYDDEESPRALNTARVEDIMTEHLVTIASHADVTELTRTMTESGVHRVFVMSGEELVGVVTTMDLVRVLGKLLSEAKSTV